MGELGNVNFVVFTEQQIRNFDNKTQIKTEIINKLPKQHANFKEQIKPYIEEYLNNDTLDKFFTDTLKTPITKIYSSHNFNSGDGSTINKIKIINTKIGDIIKVFGVFELLQLNNNNTKISDIIEKTDLRFSPPRFSTQDTAFIRFKTALKEYILNLSNLLNLLKNNEEKIKNIYALVNNQHIKHSTRLSNHKLFPEKKSFWFKDTNVTAKELTNIEEDDTDLKEQLILFQTAYEDIKNFISNNDSTKYTIKDIDTYIKGIKKSQTELITSLKNINNNFNYSDEVPHSIFATKIDHKDHIYKIILTRLEAITANKDLLEQINKSKKNIKIYLDHHYADVKVIDLVEETRNSEIDKQIKAFNNSQFSTSALSTLSTSLDKVQSKGLDYLDTVIKIIIFLIFLNLFITTYFYFTTSIEATANRSNCGGASLCEAETHRHLFLEDNGNDKARDIYIIIVVIFSIYLLSEIFKNSKDGINFDDDNNNISVPIAVLFVYFIFIVGTISGIIDKTDPKPHGINVVSSIAFMVYLFIIGVFKKENVLDNKGLTVVIALATIILEIVILAKGSEFDLFIGFSEDGSGLLNPNFNANTALHLIFLVFYLTFFIVVFTFNKDIKSLHIWGLVFLAFILFTLFIFILLASLDFKNIISNNNVDLQNITGSTLGMQYFVLILPLLCLWWFRSELNNAIKLIVLYYAILFIIYLFYVYFVNHSNEIGILSLESFQLYNWINEHKDEEKKGENSKSNHKKDLNKYNFFFVFILLIILIVIGGLNDNPNLDNIIYGIIAFIIASYITGIVYLLYNTVFPIQQASFNYKKNLVDINNEISQHIKVEVEEHTIDINKIRIFKIANDAKDIENIHTRIKQQRKDATKDETEKEKHMKNIRDIFSEISPKGSSYEDYRSQSIHQMQYEEYIYLLFSDNTDKSITSNYFNSKIAKILDNALNLKRYTDKLHNIYKKVLEDPSKKTSLTTSISKYYTDNIENGEIKTDLQKILNKYKDEYFKTIYKDGYDKNTEIVSITNVLILGAPIANNKVYDAFNPNAELQGILNDLKNIYSASNNQTEFQQYIKDVITDMVKYLELEYTQGSSEINLYNKIIINIPTNIEYLKDAHNIYDNVPLNMPKTNNIEYVIKKNYKYVTGEEGEIQKYNSDREMDQDYKNALYWIKLTDTSKKGFYYDNTYFGAKDAKAGDTYYTSEIDAEWYRVDDGGGNRHREFFSAFKYNKGSVIKTPSPGDHDNDDEIRNMLSNSSEADIFKKIGLSQINTRKIGIDTLYKMKISEFNKIKEKVRDDNRVYFMVFEDKQTKRINCYVSYNITNQDSIIKINSESYINTIKAKKTDTDTDTFITELQAYIEKTYPSPFYTIGYDYENYIYNDEDHQQMNKDTAYSIPARYYACSYLNYFPNEDGSMSKVKFAKNIKEDNYNPLNTKNTIIDRIAKSYNANAEETKIQLAPEKFHFLLVFLVILAIILLMFLFNIIKKYFTGDVYTPQMYVLGILAVFLTIFIFGEVIFARIK